MVRRLSALVLASVIAGGHVTTALCQVVCHAHHSHDVSAMAAHAGHHSHHHAADMAGPAVSGAPHTCDHQSADLVAVQRLLQVDNGPALVAVELFVPPRDAIALLARSFTLEHSPPGSFALIAQLRV